ncbi:MAG: hypothetical protein V1817_01935 [Candidatus Micrarchaeota archaeon]
MALFLPALEGGDTCSLIVKTLSEKQPLSAKQIHAHIKAGGASFSYQAVHKALQKLEREGVAEKTGRLYSLSRDWLGSLKRFAESSQPASTKDILVQSELRPQSLQFSTLIELAVFLLDAFEEISGKTKKRGVARWKHTWPGIFFSKEDYKKLNTVFSCIHCFVLVEGNTFADKLLGKYYEKSGTKMKYGVPCASECDVVVEDDYVFYVHFPPEIKRIFDSLYRGNIRASGLSLKELFSFFHDFKAPINLVIVKNAAVAEQIREETLKYFKK